MTQLEAAGKVFDKQLVYSYVHLPDGRTVSMFVNKATNLVVLDIVDANDKGGIEVYRSIV